MLREAVFEQFRYDRNGRSGFNALHRAKTAKNGESFADIVSLIKMGVPWPTMILLATAMALALALNNGTGVGALLQQFLEPILEGARRGAFLYFGDHFWRDYYQYRQ